MMQLRPNKPAAANPAIASELQGGRLWRGVADPGRYAASSTMRKHIKSLVWILLVCATGCGTTKITGLPPRYHNAQYGLTFFLPFSWRGYSVSVEQFEDTTYSAVEDKQIVVGHTPMITLRHPQWQTNELYQDIPILVFTRAQWDALHHGKLWPSAFAGGVMDDWNHALQRPGLSRSVVRDQVFKCSRHGFCSPVAELGRSVKS